MSIGKIFVAELIGTFIFLGVIMHVVSKNEQMGWIKIGLALAVAILFLGTVSGGKFNPAVSFMFLIANKTSGVQFVAEVIAQLVGALAALGIYYGIIRPSH